MRMKTRNKSILIIEDDLDFAGFLKYLVEEAGYGAVVAGTGTQAIRALVKRRPDLITLDLILPGETGIKLFRKIRSSQNWNDIPIVIITGVDANTNREISYRNFLKGVNVRAPEAYLEKPVKSDFLIQTVDKLLAVA